MTLVDDGSQPLVSAVVASYNHGKYTEANIADVAAQTYHSVELLVVNDGFSDSSVELLRGLQAKYGFDFRAQQNQGLSKTLNEVIAGARGDLIVPLGSNDIMLPQHLEKQMAHMWDKPEVGICAGNIEIIDSNGRVMSGKEQRKRDLPLRRLGFDDLFLNHKPGPMTSTLTFQQEVLEKVGGFDPDIRLEDVYVELAVTKAGYVIDILGEVLAQYREHPTDMYKNVRFTVDNVFKTYSQFSDHPDYEQVIMRFRNSTFLKCSSRDKVLARELLFGLSLKYWNEKTFRGVTRLFSSWLG